MNPVIKEGDKPFTFGGVECLVVNTDGTNMKWYPEEDLNVKSKYISKNGVYRSYQDECAGYSEVTVSIPNAVKKGFVTGIYEGERYTYTVDANKNLTKTKIPYGIYVTTLPDKTVYQEGEPIVYDGLVCTLKDGAGVAWNDTKYPQGIVPANELILQNGKAKKGETQIPVRWYSPYDTQTYQTYFTITVN